jgi:hypothetical protein
MPASFEPIVLGDPKFAAQIKENWHEPETVIRLSVNVFTPYIQQLGRSGMPLTPEQVNYKKDIQKAVTAASEPNAFLRRFMDIGLNILMSENVCETRH